MVIDESLNVSASLLGLFFGLTDRRVQQLAKNGIIPKAAKNQYPLIASVKAYSEFLRDRADGKGDHSSALDRERTRHTKAKADMAELDLAERRRELAPLDMISECVSDVFAMTKSRMRNLDRRTVGQLLGETDAAIFKRKLRHEVDLALSEIPTEIEKMFQTHLDELESGK